MIFSSSCTCAAEGVGNIPHPSQGHSFPQTMYTHVTSRLGFPKGLKLTGPTSFWWGGSAGNSWWEQQQSIAEHLELSGFFTSTAWQGAELGELDRVSLVILGLHTESNWSLLLSVCTGNPAVVASYDCRTCFNDQCRRVIVILFI